MIINVSCLVVKLDLDLGIYTVCGDIMMAAAIRIERYKT